MIILDTNVLSELMKRRPEPSVVAWCDSKAEGELVTTAITVMELHAGLEKLKPGARRSELAGKIDWVLDQHLNGRILNFDRKAAVATARFHQHVSALGTTIGLRDSQIAGIAISRRLRVATRNTSDFEGLDLIKLINPWSI